MKDIIGRELTSLAILKPLLRGLVSTDKEAPGRFRHVLEILLSVYLHFTVRILDRVHAVRATDRELCVRIKHISGHTVLQKMHRDNLLTNIRQLTECLAVLRIGNTRKIDLQELLETLTILRRMQYRVDVVENILRSCLKSNRGIYLRPDLFIKIRRLLNLAERVIIEVERKETTVIKA